jgi:hypothetical protein
MSKPLTLLNREHKGDVDPGSQRFITRKLNAPFPSYFSDFSPFLQFLMLQMPAAFWKPRLHRKHEVPRAAACMAIV